MLLNWLSVNFSAERGHYSNSAFVSQLTFLTAVFSSFPNSHYLFFHFDHHTRWSIDPRLHRRQCNLAEYNLLDIKSPSTPDISPAITPGFRTQQTRFSSPMSPSNSPPPSQSESQPESQPNHPTPVDPQVFIEYSRALYEWTLQRWLQAVREGEERRRIFLLEQENYPSRSLQSQALQSTRQTSTAMQQPAETPTSAGTETSRDESLDSMQSAQSPNRTSERASSK